MNKGSLYIVGGGLQKSRTEVFSEMIKSAGGKDAVFAFAVSASGAEPDDTFRYYRDIFVSLGVKKENCRLIPLYGEKFTDERGENALTGDNEALKNIMDDVTGVWFTGGDQYYISKCFLRADGTDTRLLLEMKNLVRTGGVVGGSSAGAAMMSRLMIGEGSNRGLLACGTKFGYAGYSPDAEDESPDSGSPLLLTEEGLGFVENAVVDQHFNRRPRMLRLLEALFVNPRGTRLGFGISEDTALIVQKGCYSVMGSAAVYVFDCAKATRTAAGCYQNVTLSVLHAGDTIDENGQITLCGKRPEGERYFQRDYISGAMPDSAIFDDAMDKMLRGEETSVFTDGDAPYVKGAVVYGAGKKTFFVETQYKRTKNTFGAAQNGQTSVAYAQLTVHSKELF